MKALSIRHPWIDLLVTGRRSFEVRSSSTRHRGPLLLHASSALGGYERNECARLGVELPRPRVGALVARARLVDCRRMTPADWDAALMTPREVVAWAWVLEDVEPIAPIPLAGRLFMFDVEADVLQPSAVA